MLELCHPIVRMVPCVALALALHAGSIHAQAQQTLSASPPRAQVIQPVTKPLGATTIGIPDITFDVAASQTLSTQRYFNLVLKNIGARASLSFDVKCDFQTAYLPPASDITASPASKTLNIPAIPVNGSYQTRTMSDDVTGASFAWRTQIKCVADSAAKSGESNKSNNTFEYSPPVPTIDTSPPDIAFDKQATDSDLGNNTLNKITVKNIGAGRSLAFSVKCDTTYSTLMADGRKEAGANTEFLKVPAMGAGSSFTTQGVNGAWVVESVKCIADTRGVTGDRNLANNTYEYRRSSLPARLGNLLTAPAVAGGLNVVSNVPDLTFDSAAMTADVDRSRGQIGYRIHVQNVGAKPSSPSEVSCTDTSDFSDTTPPYTRPVERRTWTWKRPVPAIAPGARFSDPIEVLGSERLLRRTCTIDANSSSGETNKANNGFTFQSTNAVISNATDTLSPASAASLSRFR